MLFSSLVFLFIFLPFTLIVDWLLQKFIKPEENSKVKSKNITARNIFLLIMSCIFYAWGGVYYFMIMILSITVNYIGGLLISRSLEAELNKKRIYLVLTLAINLGILFYFKYFNFLIDLISAVTSREIDIVKIVLPIGISFFTFQAMSYTIDVYQSKTKAQRNIFDLALYISLFPALIAGPIIKYGDIRDQITYRETTPEKTYAGIKRFIYGLAKKVLLANAFAEVVDKIFNNAPPELGSSVAWTGIIFYAFQIYYDFSGYSDMAIGIGKMFGFSFKENFNYPYTAMSIQDFWRRWHISLSSWFKEYLYIPLGGNRKGKTRTYINLIIVFFLTGLWHGANYTFIIWGLFYGFFLVLERMFLGEILENNTKKFFNWVYVMLVVLIAWVFFRSENVSYALEYIKELFLFKNGEKGIGFYVTINSLIALPFAVLSVGFLSSILKKHKAFLQNNTAVFYIETGIVFMLLFVCILVLANGVYNPFIYFQF